MVRCIERGTGCLNVARLVGVDDEMLEVWGDGVITSAALESDFGVKSVADRYKILGALKARLRRGNFLILPPILVYMENPYRNNT